MKHFLIFCLLATIHWANFAQISLPKFSPLQKIEQRVGMTDISLEYSRPSRKGRSIFGDLVPYGQLWRTGANRNTKITFNKKVKIGNTDIAAGTYALFTKPTETNWQIYFYSETSHWDVPDTLEKRKIAAVTTVPSIQLGRTLETLSINIEDITETTATLTIAWENTHVGIPIQLATNEVMDAIFTKELGRAATDYHIAAYYYLSHDLDLNQAKKWMEIAISIRENPDYRDHLHLSYILYKLGDKAAAIAAAKESLKNAKEKGSKYGVEANTESLKKWEAEE